MVWQIEERGTARLERASVEVDVDITDGLLQPQVEPEPGAVGVGVHDGDAVGVAGVETRRRRLFREERARRIQRCGARAIKRRWEDKGVRFSNQKEPEPENILHLLVGNTPEPTK